MLIEALKEEKPSLESVKTPLEEIVYPRIIEEDFVIVAILRAGLPMLEGCLEFLPSAKSGFLGIKRDEDTLQSSLYYSRVPDVKGKTVILVDPMVATAGSLSIALDYLISKNPANIKSLHVVASPEGIKKLESYP